MAIIFGRPPLIAESPRISKRESSRRGLKSPSKSGATPNTGLKSLSAGWMERMEERQQRAKSQESSWLAQAADVVMGRRKVTKLLVTTELGYLKECDNMLLYLNGETWTSFGSKELSDEIRYAMKEKVSTKLVRHEMPGAWGQAVGHGCEFAEFFPWSCLSRPPPQKI